MQLQLRDKFSSNTYVCYLLGSNTLTKSDCLVQKEILFFVRERKKCATIYVSHCKEIQMLFFHNFFFDCPPESKANRYVPNFFQRKKTGLQHVSRTLGTTNFGFQDRRRKTRQAQYYKDTDQEMDRKLNINTE